MAHARVSWRQRLVATGLLALAVPGAAQITVDGAGPLVPNGGEFAITENLGLLRDANLFHSFREFSLATGEVARFTGAPGAAPSPGVQNILSRVTGGTASFIDGTLHTLDYPGANLYLMNGAGLVFGPNAALAVDGAFFGTTASHIDLADGTRFDRDVSLGADSPLTSAPPSAFGFLDPGPAPITVGGSTLEVPEGRTLSLVGGDMYIESAGLTASGGRIDLVATGAPAAGGAGGRVVPSASGQPHGLAVDGFDAAGSVRLAAGSNVSASGPGGGSVFVRGGRVVLDASSVFASTTADPLPGEVPAAGVDIRAQGEVSLNDLSIVGSNVIGNVSVDHAGVRIDAAGLELADAGSEIQSIVFFGTGGGGGGDIVLTTDALSVRDGAFMRANALGPGQGGDIRISTGDMELLRGGQVFTLSFGGDAGDIVVAADSLRLDADGGGFTTLTSQSSSFFGGEGAAGAVRITTDDLRVAGGAEISSSTFGAGAGGNVVVTPGGGPSRVLVTGPGSGVFANTLFGSGAGGTVDVTTGVLRLVDGGSLQAASLFGSSGGAGGLRVAADRVEVQNRGFLISRGTGAGDAGPIVIESGDLLVTDAGVISASTLDLNLSTPGNPVFGPAAAGEILITTERLTLSGLAETSDPLAADATGIFTEAGDGRSGNVMIRADESVLLTRRARLTSSTFGAGQGGDIRIDSPHVELRDGAQVLASTFGAGDGGGVSLNASDVLVSGVNPNAFTSDLLGGETLAVSAISSQTAIGDGDAGNIVIRTGRLRVLDGGTVDTSTFGAGAGGAIEVHADATTVSGINAFAADFFQELAPQSEFAAVAGRSAISAGTVRELIGDALSGSGGAIRIQSRELTVSDGGRLSTSTQGSGPGGSIELLAEQIGLSGGAEVTAGTSATGAAGNVLVAASRLDVLGGSRVGAATSAAGAGGNVTVRLASALTVSGGRADGTTSALTTESSSTAGDAGRAGRVLVVARDVSLLDGGEISTRSAAADGGNIKLDVQDVLLLNGGRITTAVGAGAGAGGNIDIDPIFVILLASQISADAFGGPGGNIRVVTDFLFADDASAITASSASSVQGTVEIVSPDTDLSGSLAVLPAEYLDAAARLARGCEARGGVVRASLVHSARGGLPVPPGGALASYYGPSVEMGPAAARPAASLPDVMRQADTPLALPVRLECVA